MVDTSVSLTVGRAEAPGPGRHGNGGAAVHGAQVVLHVGVRGGRAEGGVARCHGGGREADQRDVGDHRTCRAETEGAASDLVPDKTPRTPQRQNLRDRTSERQNPQRQNPQRQNPIETEPQRQNLRDRTLRDRTP